MCVNHSLRREGAGSVPLRPRGEHVRGDPHQGLCPCGLLRGLTADPRFSFQLWPPWVGPTGEELWEV